MIGQVVSGLSPVPVAVAVLLACSTSGAAGPAMQFRASTTKEAAKWQQEAREKLFQLMMGGRKPNRVPLDPQVLRQDDMVGDGIAKRAGYVLKEITFQSLPDRRVHAWVAIPNAREKRGAILAVHGHHGAGEQCMRATDLYWYGQHFAELGYVVIAPDIGSHTLQHANWSLMGERTWDCTVAIDYLLSLPEVDAKRGVAVAGLSLGGETAMYVAALDERVVLTDVAGWIPPSIEFMKKGHCPCWNFSGLEENFEFRDIFSCIAPRRLVCEMGECDIFNPTTSTQAFDDIRQAYKVFGAESKLTLVIHPGGHVFDGKVFTALLKEHLGAPTNNFASFIRGTIRSGIPGGHPLAGATVRALGTTVTAKTGVYGNYALYVNPGVHEMEVSAPGRATVRVSVAVGEGKTVKRDITLTGREQ